MKVDITILTQAISGILIHQKLYLIINLPKRELIAIQIDVHTLALNEESELINM